MLLFSLGDSASVIGLYNSLLPTHPHISLVLFLLLPPPLSLPSVYKMIFGQLVCRGCCKILTYPVAAISCVCRNCGTVNAAQYLRVKCPCCDQSVLLPINTLTFLCPVCATVTDIPEEFLPKIEDPIDLGENGSENGGGHLGSSQTIYVSYPGLNTQAELSPQERERRRAALLRGQRKEQRLRDHLLRRGDEGAVDELESQEMDEEDAEVVNADDELDGVRASGQDAATAEQQQRQAQDRDRAVRSKVVIATRIL